VGFYGGDGSGASDGLEGDSFRVRKAQSTTTVKTLKRQHSTKWLDFAGQGFQGLKTLVV
jgi:hypothetical protein